MGLSPGLVVLVCICIAAIFVAGAAALHRVVAREEFTESLPAPPAEQQAYMRQLRLHKFPGVQAQEIQEPPSTSNSFV